MAGLFRFRRSRGPMELAMDMAGVRLGERVVQAGMGNPRLFAKLAGKAGLSGRACAVLDSPEAAQSLQAAAAAEGVLIEVVVAEGPTWPLENGSFDVGIVDGNALLRGDAAERASRLAEVRRTVRPSGRVLVIRPSGPWSCRPAWVRVGRARAERRRVHAPPRAGGGRLPARAHARGAGGHDVRGRVQASGVTSEARSKEQEGPTDVRQNPEG